MTSLLPVATASFLAAKIGLTISDMPRQNHPGHERFLVLALGSVDHQFTDSVTVAFKHQRLEQISEILEIGAGKFGDEPGVKEHDLSHGTRIGQLSFEEFFIRFPGNLRIFIGSRGFGW